MSSFTKIQVPLPSAVEIIVVNTYIHLRFDFSNSSADKGVHLLKCLEINLDFNKFTHSRFSFFSSVEIVFGYVLKVYLTLKKYKIYDFLKFFLVILTY